MSDQKDQSKLFSEEESEEIVIDNNLNDSPEQSTTAKTGKRKYSPNGITVDNTESDSAREILKAINNLHLIATINVKNAERKERELRYNAVSLDQDKKTLFIKYLRKASTLFKIKPLIIKHIFEDNNVDSAKKGFTLTTMAKAWLEYYGLEDSVTLEKMKKRIRSMIWMADKDFGSHIFGTPITKFRYIYYITKKASDYTKQVTALEETANMFNHVADRRDAIKEEIEKDAAVIEVTNSGSTVTSQESNRETAATTEEQKLEESERTETE